MNRHGAITGRNLTKAYARKGSPPISVLSECSFKFAPGELNVIMGTSGCGKTTLAYMLAGYVSADEGQLEMDGEPITGPSRERLMVFQETALWPWMTVEENVMFGPLATGNADREAVHERATELLMHFGLSEFARKFPGQLSGGMQRRVELAQALINSPKAMIFDEPFRGLDVMTRELMQEYFLNVFEETKVTTVFITSEIEEALFLADRILVMGGTPAHMMATIDVDLPRPRTLDCLTSSRYAELKEQAITYLYAGDNEVHAG